MRITHTGLLYDEPERSTPGYLLLRPSEGDSSFLLDPTRRRPHKHRYNLLSDMSL